VVDVVIPARNCAGSLAPTLAALPPRLIRSVVVIDNGSTDATAQTARDAGAIVLRESKVGYGRACKRAIAHLERLPRSPDVVVFLSADGSDNPADLPALLEPIRDDNAELVVGSRPSRGRGSAGNRVAIGLIGVIYRRKFDDLGPFRAIRFPALVALGMTDNGDGWNVEMQVKALVLGLRIAEVPVSCRDSHESESATRTVRSSISKTGRVLFQILRHSTAR